MDNLFSEFPNVSLQEWKDQIAKDLKGKGLSLLDFHDPIEAIDYRAFYHKEERTPSQLQPGAFPARRGSKTQNNNWQNGVWIQINSEESANKKALQLLMEGADLLLFDGSHGTFNWKRVLEGIELKHIRTQFKVSSAQEALSILQSVGNVKNHISFCFDALTTRLDSSLIQAMKEEQIASYVVNGFGVQQCGATTWQEIAFCLSAGHEMLLQLMNEGFSIDDASAQIHFHVGVGAIYFNEIAKFRALRELWSKIIDAYNPTHNCSYNCQMTAIVGHTNKSLRDPYTNLLRQTTEAMSAASAADAIIVLPYDFYNNKEITELSSRMALNISLLLKEESYMHSVLDATGGSFSVETLTDIIGRKAWEKFQALEKAGGISTKTVLEELKIEINEKRDLRIKALETGTATLIGVNKYPDPNEKSAEWQKVPGYLGMNAFVADLIIKNETI